MGQININIGCIETDEPQVRMCYPYLININIGCIETMITRVAMTAANQININIGCIETKRRFGVCNGGYG